MKSQKELVEAEKSVTRDIRFDILKTLGIFSIILAHIIPQNIFFNIRNFDVPLMVIVSGSLFYCSSYKKNYSLLTYLHRRIPRLIAPVWLFLSFYFISISVVSYLLGKDYPFLLKKHIINSFLLLDGIGYVWVIRVFILMAIISTIIMNLYKSCRSKNHFFTVLLFIYICYEILLKIATTINLVNIPFLSSLINNYVFYTISYGCLFGLGIALPTMKRKSILVVAGVFLTVFLLVAGYLSYTQGVIPSMQNFKYPPRIYYLSYGIFMSMLTFSVVDILCKKYNLNNQENPIVKAIVFISTSTLWIYLWHILFLYLKQSLVQIKPDIATNYIIFFLLITILSVTATYIQKTSISRLIQNTKFGHNNSEMLAILFLK
ncbi:acyltransferase [Nostoc sp.]|uniref:acyltransferase n=1 Tax=Nostoc sp. TaxID=1180 RepID=UPI002FF4F9B0